jgi:ADP-ribosylglycohydrolase
VKLLRRTEGHEETADAILQAMQLAARGESAERAIAELGGGWIAEEALAISIYCAATAENFSGGVINAVNHSGDSDSTGSITGNLLGVILGEEVIPDTWLDSLELKNVIVELADDLHDFRSWEIGMWAVDDTFDKQIWEKYPGW